VSVDDDNKLDEMVNSIVAAELADIVLVKKNEMEEWQRRQD
jgi:biopolymer transport protein ExbB/TolQ